MAAVRRVTPPLPDLVLAAQVAALAADLACLSDQVARDRARIAALEATGATRRPRRQDLAVRERVMELGQPLDLPFQFGELAELIGPENVQPYGVAFGRLARHPPGIGGVVRLGEEGHSAIWALAPLDSEAP
jgi:hypothetical protein